MRGRGESSDKGKKIRSSKAPERGSEDKQLRKKTRKIRTDSTFKSRESGATLCRDYNHVGKRRENNSACRIVLPDPHHAKGASSGSRHPWNIDG